MNLRSCLLALFLFLPCLAWSQPLSPELAANKIEAVDLALEPRASFVDAAFFVQAWRKWCPSENCVLLRLDEEQGEGQALVSAAVVYTKGGKVFSRSLLCGLLPLEELTPADLQDRGKITQAFLRAAQGKEKTPRALYGAPLQQLLITSARIRSAPGGDELCFAVGKITKTIKRDGVTRNEELEYLVFDHDGVYYAYRPGSSGTWAVAYPKDKTLGYADPCVRGGDLMDAVLYLLQLRKREPGVKARISGLGTETLPAPRGLACVLIQRGRNLEVHHLYLGNFPLNKVSVSDFDNEAVITKALVANYAMVYRRTVSALTEVSVKNVKLGYDDLMDFFASLGPMGMPGDSERLQVLRVVAFLKAAGVEVQKLGSDGGARFVFEGKRFSYSPQKGSGLLVAPKTLPPEPTDAKNAAAPAEKPRAGVATKYVPSKEELAALETKADGGDLKACRDFGLYLFEGNGLPKDTNRAVQYLAKAAEGGDGECAVVLAKRFDKDDAPVADLEKARKFYLIAAKSGFPVAMYNYGAMLYSARGGKRDIREGLAWLIVAGRSGFKGPGEADARRDLAKSETAIPEAEARAEEIYQSLPDSRSPGKFSPKTEQPKVEMPKVRL